MNKEQIIEEMAKVMCGGCADGKECMQCLCADWYRAEALYNAGYRKETQGECEYCKTGEEKCQTCTEFYVDIDNRCSGYDDGKCIEYTPVKHCFNCGRKMRGE